MQCSLTDKKCAPCSGGVPPLKGWAFHCRQCSCRSGRPTGSLRDSCGNLTHAGGSTLFQAGICPAHGDKLNLRVADQRFFLDVPGRAVSGVWCTAAQVDDLAAGRLPRHQCHLCRTGCMHYVQPQYALQPSSVRTNRDRRARRRIATPPSNSRPARLQ